MKHVGTALSAFVIALVIAANVHLQVSASRRAAEQDAAAALLKSDPMRAWKQWYEIEAKCYGKWTRKELARGATDLM